MAEAHGVSNCAEAERQLSPFALFLTGYLRARGWSAAEFARRSGIPEGTVGSWMRDTRGVSVRHLDKIAETLGVPPQIVLAAILDEPHAPPSAWGRFAQWMEALPDLTGLDELTTEELDVLWRFALRIAQVVSVPPLKRRD